MMEDQRIINSKKALKQSLLTLLKEKPQVNITVTELAAHADVNRGTFYQHYKTINQLFVELSEDAIEDLIRAYREPYLGSHRIDFRELTSTTIKIFEHLYSFADFYTVIIDSAVYNEFKGQIHHFLKQLALRELQESAHSEEINEGLYASYHANAMITLITEWIQEGFPYTPEYMNQQLIHILNFHPDGWKENREK